MEILETKFFVFGSFLKKSNYKDIDVLVVIPSIENLSIINASINELSTLNPGNIVHIQIYSNNEYYNEDNKFSYKKVQHEISIDDLAKLYKIRPTIAST